MKFFKEHNINDIIYWLRYIVHKENPKSIFQRTTAIQLILNNVSQYLVIQQTLENQRNIGIRKLRNSFLGVI